MFVLPTPHVHRVAVNVFQMTTNYLRRVWVACPAEYENLTVSLYFLVIVYELGRLSDFRCRYLYVILHVIGWDATYHAMSCSVHVGTIYCMTYMCLVMLFIKRKILHLVN